ncbi:MAG: hypothetical protein QM479_07860 [Pseudomonadota bacterium]
MNIEKHWEFFNKFPLINFDSGSIFFTGVNSSGLEKKYSIKDIDPVIINALKKKRAFAQYSLPPSGVTWKQNKYLTIKLNSDESLIRSINHTLYAIKAYEMFSNNSGSYIRDYNLGQVSELLEIFPLVTTDGNFIDLSSIFNKLTKNARASLINIYKKNIFVKFPLPQDVDIAWSKL